MVVQLNRDGSHVAEHDTQQDKRKERRHPDPGRYVIEPDAGQDDDYDEEEEEGGHTELVLDLERNDSRTFIRSGEISLRGYSVPEEKSA